MSEELTINPEYATYAKLGWPHCLIELRNMCPKAIARYLRGKKVHEEKQQQPPGLRRRRNKYGPSAAVIANDEKYYHSVNQLYLYERPIILHRWATVSLWALSAFLKLECRERWDVLQDLQSTYRAEGRSNLTFLIKGKRTGVYFIQPVGGGPIKIGWSHDYEERLVSLQAFSPVILRAIAFISGRRWWEAEIHKRFSKHRLHGEWFSPHKDLLEYIYDTPWEVEVLE